MTTSFDDILHKVSDEEARRYRRLAEKALSLGYRVQKDRTKTPSYSFVSRRYRQTLLRLVDDGKKVGMRIKFYGVRGYSEVFQEALKRTIEEYDFRYTGCYGCGRCQNGPLGYTVDYPDGRRYFRCGQELIEFQVLDDATLIEAERLMEGQTQDWEERLGQPPN